MNAIVVHRSRPSGSLRLVALHTPLLAILLAGCSRDIDTLYGRREGLGASASVNGTAVLGEMFEQAGHRVYSWQTLSPRLSQRADCIVWFPDDFQPPSKEVRQWLEEWLAEKPERTLVYVGRDFDAAMWYWQHVLPNTPAEQRPLVAERLQAAKTRFRERRDLDKNTEKDCGWFTLNDSQPMRQVQKITSDPQWLDGVDASRLEIELRRRLSPPTDAEVLLKSGDDVLVSRQTIEQGHLIVVANGSFLLNLPLVNHEHRKLAGRLIDEVGSTAKRVAFLESGSGGPAIRDRDPAAAAPTGLEMFDAWPTNWILLHLTALGVIFCFSRWPIFGRPGSSEANGASDFGRHIDALAQLLKRSRDRDYATEKIEHYRRKTGADK